MATSTDFLLCSICLSEFKSPKILSCFHSFCKGCLSSYLEQWARNGSFNCPLCRCHLNIPSGGVDGFSNNYYIQPPVSKETDDVCDEIPEAEVVELGDSEIRDIINNLSSDKVNPAEFEKCTEHKRDLDLFCRDCNVPICSKCLLRKHKQHDFVDVDAVVMETRMKINELKTEMEEKLSELTNFSKSISAKIVELYSNENIQCLKMDALVEVVCQAARQLGTDIKHDLHLTCQADVSQLNSSVADYDKETLVENLKQISKIDEMHSVNDLLNVLQTVNSDMRRIRNWSFQQPRLHSPDFLNKFNEANFFKLMKLYLEFQVQGQIPAPIAHLLGDEEYEIWDCDIVGKCISVTKVFDPQSLSQIHPIYSDEFFKHDTKWYVSLSQSRTSNKIWISLFFNGSISQTMKCVTARFTLKLINTVNEDNSLIRRGVKIFYPPRGLVADSYDWKNVINVKTLTDKINGFIQGSRGIKVEVEVVIISIDLF